MGAISLIVFIPSSFQNLPDPSIKPFSNRSLFSKPANCLEYLSPTLLEITRQNIQQSRVEVRWNQKDQFRSTEKKRKYKGTRHSYSNSNRSVYSLNGLSKRSSVSKCIKASSQAGNPSEPSHPGLSDGKIIREVLTKEGRERFDDAIDSEFYATPRFVTYFDDEFISTLTQLFRERLPEDGEILDLMSSWVSHLPSDVECERVVGHGLNAAELSKNPSLSYFFVKDLNQDPKLDVSDQSFDAVICTVGVQYLQQPERVFAEIHRVLRPGGIVIMSFSNLMFRDKAIIAWKDGTEEFRVELVKQYFGCVQGFTEPEVVTERNTSSNTEPNSFSNPFNFFTKLGKFLRRSPKNPFYAIVAYKNFKPVKKNVAS